jgi:hypothetical protein
MVDYNKPQRCLNSCELGVTCPLEVGAFLRNLNIHVCEKDQDHLGQHACGCGVTWDTGEKI